MITDLIHSIGRYQRRAAIEMCRPWRIAHSLGSPIRQITRPGRMESGTDRGPADRHISGQAPSKRETRDGRAYSLSTSTTSLIWTRQNLRHTDPCILPSRPATGGPSRPSDPVQQATNGPAIRPETPLPIRREQHLHRQSRSVYRSPRIRRTFPSDRDHLSESHERRRSPRDPCHANLWRTARHREPSVASVRAIGLALRIRAATASGTAVAERYRTRSEPHRHSVSSRSSPTRLTAPHRAGPTHRRRHPRTETGRTAWNT